MEELADESARDPELREHMQRFDEASKPVLAALHERGVTVERLVPLANSRLPSADAAAVLIDWLPRVGYLPVKKTMARALVDPAAGAGAVAPLVSEWKKASNEDPEWLEYKDALARAVAVNAPDDEEVLFELLSDRSLGPSRGWLLHALPRHADQRRAAEAVLTALGDEQIYADAIQVAGAMRLDEAAARIEELAGHSDPDVRKYAKQALKQIR